MQEFKNIHASRHWGGNFVGDLDELGFWCACFILACGTWRGACAVAWAMFFGLAVFLHFVHDSVGIGWGIKWLWPFSRKAYKCFSEKDGAFSRRLLIA